MKKLIAATIAPIYKTKKKVVILTQSVLNGNYGCTLQAYALQNIINSLGYSVSTDVANIRKLNIMHIGRCTKRLVLQHISRKTISIILTPRIKKIIYKNLLLFVNKNIEIVDIYNGNKKPDKNLVNKFNVIVVGSDQVWRKKYSNIPVHLLDFTKKINIKRISYAASFGLDDISEYGPVLKRISKKLAKRFNAISVREDSGVAICKRHWGIEAEHLIDPTLLLDKNHYINLVNKDKTNIKKSDGNLFVYILDNNGHKKQIINNIASKLKLKQFEIMPQKPDSNKEFYKDPNKYVLPSVTQWLKSFIDAKFIVTDSFHGCVFSIIFNKPFIAIGNKKRGMARFTSLFKMFNLEDRLISSADELTDKLILSEINWPSINRRISREQNKSNDFLRKNLG